MKYLKRFNTEAAYNEYINSGSSIYLPNVSLIDNGNVSKFNDAKWNQLIPGGNFDGTGNWIVGYISGSDTYSISNNILQINKNYIANNAVGVRNDNMNIISGNTYILSYSMKMSCTATNNTYLSYVGSPTQWTETIVANSIPNWSRRDNRFVANSNKFRLWVGPYWGSSYNDAMGTFVVYIKNIQLFDLTAIYGKGNEPSVADFRSEHPADYYPYKPL